MGSIQGFNYCRFIWCCDWNSDQNCIMPFAHFIHPNHSMTLDCFGEHHFCLDTTILLYFIEPLQYHQIEFHCLSGRIKLGICVEPYQTAENRFSQTSPNWFCCHYVILIFCHFMWTVRSPIQEREFINDHRNITYSLISYKRFSVYKLFPIYTSNKLDRWIAQTFYLGLSC